MHTLLYMTLTIQCIDWYVQDAVDETQEGETQEENMEFFQVDVFGKTKEGTSIAVHVTDYTPFLYYKPPIGYADDSSYNLLFEYLQKQLKKWEKNDGQFVMVSDATEHLIYNGIEYKKSIWGYNFEQEECYYKFSFKSVFAYKKVMYILKSFQQNTLNIHQMESIYESLKDLPFENQYSEMEFLSKKLGVKTSLIRNIYKMGRSKVPLELSSGKLFDVIDNILRFAHEKDIRMASWLQITDYEHVEQDEKTTTCDIEITTTYDNIEKYESDKIQSDILEMAFDIEAYSPDDKFPDANNETDPVYQIGITFKRYIDKKARRILLHYTGKDFRNQGMCLQVPTVEICTRASENTPDLCKNKMCVLNGHQLEYITPVIENYNTEKELLMRFHELIIKESPDMIYTYNGDKFDWNYLMIRAQMTNCYLNFCKLSKVKDYSCKVEVKKFQSSAYGDNEYLRVDIPGRLNIDLMIWVQRNMPADKYPDYKLDTIAEKEIGQKKHDISFKEIFKAYREADEKLLTRIGDYCLQDTILVQKLVIKLDVITQLFEMANLASVPVQYLLSKGQQIKVYSIITKDAMNKGYVTPLLDSKENNSFTGAIVLEPTPGVFTTPVAVLDFASLYPSIQMAYKICYTTIVLDITLQAKLEELYSLKKDLVIGDSKFDVIDWTDDTIQHYNEDSNTTFHFSSADAAKEATGTSKKIILNEMKKQNGSFKQADKRYIYFYAQNKTCIIPDMQVQLKSSRKAVKKMMAQIEHSDNEEDQLTYRVLNGRQLAIKVTMNSIYGFTSAFMLNLAPLAACVTAKGRQMIEMTRNFMENEFEKIARNQVWTRADVESWYTDKMWEKQSVLGEKGWTRKYPAAIIGQPWSSKSLGVKVVGGDSVCSDTPILCKLQDGSIMYTTISSLGYGSWTLCQDEKEYQQCNVKVWSDKGFTSVKHIMRHKTSKKMYRVCTPTGIVDVTEDHSLLDKNGNELKTIDVKKGQELLHFEPIDSLKNLNNISIEYAWTLGLFFTYGKCGKKCGWEIKIDNVELQKKALEGLQPDISFTIDSDKIVPNDTYHKVNKMTEQYRNWFYNGHGFLKKVPDFILNSTCEIKKSFLKGICKNKCHGKIGTAGLYHLFRDIGSSVIIQNVGAEEYILSCRDLEQQKLNEISNITELSECTQYVYDIETQNHHFHVGPGAMIVHNTDSVFSNFPHSTLEETISLNHKAEVILTDKVFNRKPIEMEYEKTYYPMVIVKKKNYIGVKYEMDPNRWKIDYKGIAIKRRNYCEFVKKTYWNVIYPSLGLEYDPILKKVMKATWDVKLGPGKALKALSYSLSQLVIHNKNTVKDYTDFMISASLKSNYKTDRLPHVQLARRMNERDPMQAPKTGQRFSYVIVRDDSRPNDLFANSEDAEYAKEQGLSLDYLYYLNNQIRKPLTTFLGLSGTLTRVEDIFDNTQQELFQILKDKRQENMIEAKKGFLNGKRPTSVIPLKTPKRVKKKIEHGDIASFFSKKEK
jgi:DNA polymerase elongation subunit (family B)